MKLIIVLAAFAVGQASLLTHLYVPLNARPSKNVHILNKHFIRSPIYNPYGQNINEHSSLPGSNAYGQNVKPNFVERLKVVQAARERYASKLLQNSLNDTMINAYENKKGISKQGNTEEKEVATDDVQSHIGYYYVGDDGKIYYLRYLADTSGYLPQSGITANPAANPAAFMKGLEKIGRAHISDVSNIKDKTGLCHENKCEPGRVYSGRIFNRNSIYKKTFYPSNKLNQNIGH